MEEAFRGSKVSPSIIGEFNKKACAHFGDWRNRLLQGVRFIVGDKCLGMLEPVEELLPDTKYQRCLNHIYRSVFSVVPKSKVKLVSKRLKEIDA